MNNHVKNEKLISFICEEHGNTEYESIQAHLNECEACRDLCKDLKSILNSAPRIPTPPISEHVIHTIQMYADTTFSKQQKVKRPFSNFFFPLFSHQWVYAVSLVIVIIISIIFLYPGKRNHDTFVLDDVQFDAAIAALQEEIDEYSWEFEDNQFTYLDEDITDLENTFTNFDEEYNYLF